MSFGLYSCNFSTVLRYPIIAIAVRYMTSDSSVLERALTLIFFFLQLQITAVYTLILWKFYADMCHRNTSLSDQSLQFSIGGIVSQVLWYPSTYYDDLTCDWLRNYYVKDARMPFTEDMDPKHTVIIIPKVVIIPDALESLRWVKGATASTLPRLIPGICANPVSFEEGFTPVWFDVFFH